MKTKKTEHTAGPLIVRESGNGDYTVERLDSELRSVISHYNESELCPEHGGSAKGNALLHAAAPELLACLRDAVDRMQGSSPAITILRKRSLAALALAGKVEG